MQRDVFRGRFGLYQIIHESMLHMAGRAQYVEGVLQSVVRVAPVCIGVSSCKGGLGRMKQLSQDKAGVVRKDGWYKSARSQ